MAAILPEKTKTLIIVLLDESGSMGSMKNDVIGGYNEFLSQQKKVGTDVARVILIKFNTITSVGHAPLDLGAAPQLSSQNYSPGGGTALFDAIAEGVRMADKTKLAEERVICLIMTDGEENASKETTLKQVQDIIAAKEATGDWTFVYIGEQPTGWAGKTGLSTGNTRQYQHANPRQNFAETGIALERFRGAQVRSTRSFY